MRIHNTKVNCLNKKIIGYYTQGRKFTLFISLIFYLVISVSIPVLSQVTNDSKNKPDQNNHSAIPESALLLSKYIQYPSVSGSEKDAAEFLVQQCKDKGLYVKIFSDKQGGYNFAASLYPLDLGLPNIIFLNHMDVVPTGDLSDWDFKPFSGKIEKGMIYGRGSIDMKGMAIMQLEAIAKFKAAHSDEQEHFNVTLLCVSGEEDFGPMGAGWVVNNFLDVLNPVAVYGEGGSGVY